MLQELNRRLDVINGFVDGINERAEANMPEISPPYPNRLIRRQQIAKQIEENLFSPDLQQLYESVPHSYGSPQESALIFIQQLIENEKPEEREREEREKRKTLILDNIEYTSVLAQRNTKRAPQNV